MALEISVGGTLTVVKAGVTYPTNGLPLTISLGNPGSQFTMSGNLYIQNTISVGFAAEEAIPMGEVTAPHWSFFTNLDATNYIQLRRATGLSAFARLYPGEFALFPLDNAATAPFVIANTAACLMQYLILSY